jgi:hypothetical protein
MDNGKVSCCKNDQFKYSIFVGAGGESRALSSALRPLLLIYSELSHLRSFAPFCSSQTLPPPRL